jgi:hypothetical protein
VAIVLAVLPAVLVASMLLPPAAGADFLRVPDDFPSISLALVAAEPGDVIGVRAGSYVDVIELRTGITILGGYDPTFTERDPLLHETSFR